MKTTVGADIEFIIVSEDGSLLSAIDLLEGTKKRPSKYDNGSIFRDNVNLEFNMGAHNSQTEFRRNVISMIRTAKRLINPHLLSNLSSAIFDRAMLENEEAQTMGCNPDFNAWTREMNIVPEDVAQTGFRSVGGHVHVGNASIHEPKNKLKIIQMMDFIIGIPSIIMDVTKGSYERRQLYGRAGCHRPTSYGVEYRVLSSFWAHSPSMIDFIYDMATMSEKIAFNSTYDEIISLNKDFNAQDIINNCDVDLAKKCIPIIEKIIDYPFFVSRIMSFDKYAKV